LREHSRILGARADATDHITWLQTFFGPAVAAEQIHGLDFQAPVLSVYVQIDVRMRIRPKEFRDGAGDRGGAGHIEGCGGMVGE